jgi:hypothetical protein
MFLLTHLLESEPATRKQALRLNAEAKWPVGRIRIAREGEDMSPVSFAEDIRPLFRAIDVSHMKRFNVELDNYTFMSNPNNANQVLAAISPHDGEPPTMPPGGPYWTEAQLALFVQWQKDGYRP